MQEPILDDTQLEEQEVLLEHADVPDCQKADVRKVQKENSGRLNEHQYMDGNLQEGQEGNDIDDEPADINPNPIEEDQETDDNEEPFDPNPVPAASPFRAPARSPSPPVHHLTPRDLRRLAVINRADGVGSAQLERLADENEFGTDMVRTE